MKRNWCFVIVLLGFFVAPVSAQKKPDRDKKVPLPLPAHADKKYPSLLWEITGHGLKKPSYLFGTMHVSNKLAFHLGDSFYNALKSAAVVALETNPESWQDDFSKSTFFSQGRKGGNPDFYREGLEMPNDHMLITTFAIDSYDEMVKAALALEPSMINGMLYRTYGGEMDDFEEDTFLDMYIFQVGRKLGKRVSGVENFEESEKLVAEAYRDMVRDKHKKRKSYDYEGMMTNPKKVEDAYRKGDLDLLDSLQSLTVFSDAFQEKFLYKRNEIQANSIDSIIQKATLFVGVGAAHLPGKRGVIEMLRQKGYSVRPISMGDRNSVQKDAIDKIRVAHPFVTQTANDGFYQVAIPGKKFYEFTNWGGMDVVQYADMVNGAYYLVTRIKTNSSAWGHSPETVYKKIDNYLYENIPGKILKKTPIMKNGYRGCEVLNRTRRGDYQRYQLFITPFEIIVFKMSGNGDYISTGLEATRFFNSIRLKEYVSGEWITWQPVTGGFSVQLPHTPSLLRDNNYGTDRLEYAAFDKKDSNSYLIMKVNLHNYSFLEEDSFELDLMDESYGYSAFIDQQLDHRFSSAKGYPALTSKYKHTDGSYSAVKYIIRGPVYYALIVRYKRESPAVRRFLESFTITPFIYPPVKQEADTTLHFTVKTPVYLKQATKNETASDDMERVLQSVYEEEAEDGGISRKGDAIKTTFIGNDSIGEKVFVTYFRLPKYSFEKDSSRIWKYLYGDDWNEDSSFIYRVNKQYNAANGMKCREIQVMDTGSSRTLRAKLFYKDGHFFSVSALTDTLSTPSSFLANFFSSFTPVDTLRGASIFTRKTAQFMQELFSKDSLVAKKAANTVYQVDFDSLDVPLLTSAIDSLHWGIRNYLSLKKHFIATLGTLKAPVILPYLRQLYWKAGDTADLQHAILDALLAQRTKGSFLAFKELMLQEPPIDDKESYGAQRYISPVQRISSGGKKITYRISTGEIRWNDLYDTLALTKEIFPEFLQLMNVDDYRDNVMDLLRVMTDSGYLKGADYETYFSKLYLDGKQLLKKQLAKENKEKMDKAERTQLTVFNMNGLVDMEDEHESDEGNDALDQYAVLLLPFWDRHPGIQNFFTQLMTTHDRRLLYNSMQLLLRNQRPVPDSLFTKYAGLDEYRSELYQYLKELGQLNKFPAAYKTQLAIARSLLVTAADSYGKMDTIVYLDKLPVTYKTKKGFVYFFKYKRMRDDSNWQLASIGMQPENPAEIDTENDDFMVQGEERKLENDQPVPEQLQKRLKEMVNAKRPAATIFYEARSYSMVKGYLSEMVKTRRYRD